MTDLRQWQPPTPLGVTSPPRYVTVEHVGFGRQQGSASRTGSPPSVRADPALQVVPWEIPPLPLRGPPLSPRRAARSRSVTVGGAHTPSDRWPRPPDPPTRLTSRGGPRPRLRCARARAGPLPDPRSLGRPRRGAARQPGDRRPRRLSPRRSGGPHRRRRRGTLRGCRPRGRRSRGAAGRRCRRRTPGVGHTVLRTVGAGCCARREQGLRQGGHGCGRRADRSRPRLHHRGRGGARAGRDRLALRRQGGRPGRRQGRRRDDRPGTGEGARHRLPGARGRRRRRGLPRRP